MPFDPSSLFHTLKLGDGIILTSTMTNVSDPLVVSFCKDILRLNEIWDNSSHDWQGHSVLSIKGRPIYINYWPDVYHYMHNQQWQGTKHKWGCWRSIIQHYHQGTPEKFRHEFNENGQPMCYTHIVTCLHETCMKADQEVFDVQCSYRKGSEMHVLSWHWAITKRLHRLGETSSRN
ncbi:hypothetical protein PAXRUDRAFT_35221 [Paxillus rubicundulus Ve08.2h10]|uniref:Uncharacterized protein n=1 Tax=Paxillus rubicundulus Ve08.2h10 TaxID=930991 RepID=A0A0D0E1W1_9AGAM|nr:hypothetical protein PAXRUDRAFT_35221 [Paxillus rubicundulus Ve08.2h10]